MFLDWKNQCCENDYTKAIYRFNAISIKLPMAFVTELLITEQKISQFVWKHKRPQTAKAILRENTGLEQSTFLTSDYTTKLQSPRQYGIHTKTNTAQWNKTESSEISPRTYGHLLFDRGGKNNEEKTASSLSGAGKTGQLHVKEWNQKTSNTIHKNKLKMD